MLYPICISMISIHALREEGDGSGLPPVYAFWNFYPRPPRGGRQRGAHYAKRRIEFLSPPSARRATRLPLRHKGEQIYFYPRPPRGGRLRPPAPCCPGRYFYPRPPRGGRHPGGLGDHQKVGISIPALREEGDPAVPATRSASSYFYPRPPRGGRLSWPSKEAVPRRHISIPALREEGDTVYMRGCKVDSEFLSPPSARRATARRLRRKEAITYFYPRPPRGGRLHLCMQEALQTVFLSPPSARRATLLNYHLAPADVVFLSPPSARRATFTCAGNRQIYRISIPALREEGDPGQTPGMPRPLHFYPRPPRGGRRLCRLRRRPTMSISIPALREEGDGHRGGRRRVGENFYPRPPRGGRHVEADLLTAVRTISIPALREEGDRRPLSDHTRA